MVQASNTNQTLSCISQEPSEILLNDDANASDSENEQWLSRLSKISRTHAPQNVLINNSFTVQRKISYHVSGGSSSIQTKSRSYTPGQNKSLQSAKLSKEMQQQAEES